MASNDDLTLILLRLNYTKLVWVFIFYHYNTGRVNWSIGHNELSINIALTMFTTHQLWQHWHPTEFFQIHYTSLLVLSQMVINDFLTWNIRWYVFFLSLLVQIMAWWSSHLPEPMMTQISDVIMPRWVNCQYHLNDISTLDTQQGILSSDVSYTRGVNAGFAEQVFVVCCQFL